MSFPFLLARLGTLKIEHLQLDEKTTEAFRRRGVSNISELVGVIGGERYPTTEGLEAVAALDRLAAASGPRDVDWLAYWRGNGYAFHHRFLTCPELEEMDASNPVCGIGKTNFGNAGAMLGRAGIQTLGDLAAGLREGLPDIPGMGAKKWAELFGTLVELVRDLRDGRISKDFLAKRYPLGGEAPPAEVTSHPSFELRQGARALHVGVLHLGAKAAVLEAQGVRNVGDAAAALPRLLSLPGIGRATTTVLEMRLAVLADAQTEDGDVDWERYCSGIGTPLLPRAGDPADGEAFVGGLAGMISEIGDSLDDPVLRLIIDRRLSRLPHRRATLEEIATAHGVDLTRERVRQIEARFLKWMVSALLDDNYGTLDVHFRPGFARFWRAAAERFSGSEEISHAALVEGLADVWGVDAALVARHLPFIVTLITGDVPTGKSLGDGARLGEEFANLPAAAASLPMRRLQIGKQVRTLEAHGLDTLGKFVDAVRNGAISRSSGSQFRLAIDHLGQLSGVLDEDSGLNWPVYLARTGTGLLPSIPTVTPVEFLRTLVPTLTALLESAAPTNRSALIFARRTSRPVEVRIPTEALAAELGTHGSSIKREETVLLAFLNAVLIGSNLAMAGVHLRDGFIEMWKDAAECLEAADGDAEGLTKLLSSKWHLRIADVAAALPTIMAVLTGYPYKRLGRYSRMVSAPAVVIPLPAVDKEQEEAPARIVLRGFRRHH